MKIECSEFGKTCNYESTKLISLTNAKGSKLCVTNFGAHVVSLSVADAYGNFSDVCLGFDEASAYEGPGNAYMGATVGRYANRVKNAEFQIDGIKYKCRCNEGNNMLHGGMEGFDKKLWNYRFDEKTGKLVMNYTSPDMEEGFPGELYAEVSFFLSDEDELVIEYFAKSDKDTAINLTNHSYFNLSSSGDVMDHSFKIDAEFISELDDEKLSTGWLAEVGNTPFDLRKPRTLRSCLGERLEHPMFDNANGFDASYLLNGEGFRMVAEVTEPVSGRRMLVYTDMPAMQFYSGQLLSVSGKNGSMYQPYSGFAFETQFPPDSINTSDEGLSILRAGEEFRSKTVYAFEIIDE